MTKIMIVEDEAALVTLLKYNLEKQGYETVAVMDGKEVMNTAITEKPDLKAIAKYIEETGDITQFHFGERGESLRIK